MNDWTSIGSLLTLGQSLWVLFGANVGTTMTGWLVALVGLKFKIDILALPLVGIGMALRLSGGNSRRGALEMAAATRETPLPAPAEAGKFAAQAEALLDAVDPEMKPNGIPHVEPGLQALEEHYQSLKSHLLEAGAQGYLQVAEMDARLRAACATRRAMQQAVKALRMLNSKTSADGTVEPPDQEEQP